MADSIREQIFQRIETNMKALTEIRTVSRGKIDPLSIELHPAVFIMPGNDAVIEYLGDLIDRDMVVFLVLWIKTPVEIHKYLESIVPAIQKKIAGDPTLDGKALDITETNVSEPFPLNDEQEDAAVVMDYRVLYRVRRDDPYSQS